MKRILGAEGERPPPTSGPAVHTALIWAPPRASEQETAVDCQASFLAAKGPIMMGGIIRR